MSVVVIVLVQAALTAGVMQWLVLVTIVPQHMYAQVMLQCCDDIVTTLGERWANVVETLAPSIVTTLICSHLTLLQYCYLDVQTMLCEYCLNIV